MTAALSTVAADYASTHESNRPCGCQHAARVIALENENHQLRQELQKCKAERKQIENKYTADAELMFQQAAERQSRLDALETQQLSSDYHAIFDAPMVTPPSTIHNAVNDRSISITHDWLNDEWKPLNSEVPDITESNSSSTFTDSKKTTALPKALRMNALRETSSNSKLLGSWRDVHMVKKRKIYNGRTSAILALAEDSEHSSNVRHVATSPHQRPKYPNPVNSKLKVLLSTPPSSSKPLHARNGARLSPRGRTQTETEASCGVMENMRSSEMLPSPHRPATLERAIRKSTDLKSDDRRVFRSEAFHKQKTSDFKPKPNQLDAKPVYFGNIRGRQNRQRSSKSTEPGRYGQVFRSRVSLKSFQSSFRNVSDSEILLQFLGPGSEQRVLQLTPSARINLLHEARTKLMADEFGQLRSHRVGRNRSPTGFWRTDLSGSQEESLKTKTAVE